MSRATPGSRRRAFVFLVLAGCATPPAAWVPPRPIAIATTVLRTVAAPESRPHSAPARVSEVRLRAFALPTIPSDAAATLATEVRSFRRPADGVPLRAVGAGTVHGRAATGAMAESFVRSLADGTRLPCTSLGEAVVIAGADTRVVFSPRVDDVVQGALTPARWTLEAIPAAGAYRAEITLVRFLADAEDAAEAGSPTGATRKVRHEDRLLLAGTTAPGTGPLALVVPWSDRRGEPFALVLVLDVLASENATPERAHEALLGSADRAERAAASRPASRAELENQVVTTLWLRLSERPHQRAALARAAEYGSATLSADVVLTADAGLVARICERAAELAQRAGGPPADRARLGWFLERACIERLAEEAQRGTLSPALEGQMWVHLGDAARGLDSLLRAVDRIGSCAAFRAWLAEEQWNALSDRIPSVRLRAHAWLQRAGRPVPDYDPLGPLEARRAALRALEDAAAGQPSAGGAR